MEELESCVAAAIDSELQGWSKSDRSLLLELMVFAESAGGTKFRQIFWEMYTQQVPSSPLGRLYSQTEVVSGHLP